MVIRAPLNPLSSGKHPSSLTGPSSPQSQPTIIKMCIKGRLGQPVDGDREIVEVFDKVLFSKADYFVTATAEASRGRIQGIYQ